MVVDATIASNDTGQNQFGANARFIIPTPYGVSRVTDTPKHLVLYQQRGRFLPTQPGDGRTGLVKAQYFAVHRQLYDLLCLVCIPQERTNFKYIDTHFAVNNIKP
jgi:hypothetical protein